MNTMAKCLMALALLAGPVISNAQSYTFTTIPTPPGDTVEPYLGINNTGQIVGNYLNSSGGYQPYIYNIYSGILTPISVPAAYSSNILAGGINDSGQIVGVYGLIGGTPTLQGFSYSGGTFTTINVPGDAYTVVNGINNAGQIVGYGATSLGAPNQAFLDSAGTFTTISGPGATALVATGINIVGEIAGFFGANGASHGFVDSGGTFTTIDVPGATNTQVFGINDSGQIVGTAWGFPGEPNGGTEAFVGSGGTFTIINSYGSYTVAFGINNAGEIVGYGDEGAFLAIPVSSPLTLACPAATAQVGVPYSSALTAAGGIPPDTFSISTGSLPPVLSLNTSKGTITGTPSTAGPFSFTGKVVDSSGLAAGTVTATCTITVSPGSQTITFNPAAALLVGGSEILSASASSGLTVSFSSQTPSMCSVTGTTVKGLETGQCTVAANQKGNANYSPAPTVTQTIKVNPSPLQLSVTPTSLSFGTVPRFSLLVKIVTLKNTGTGAVSISKVSVTPGAGTDSDEFTPLSFCPSSLAVGKKCAIIVVFFADDLGSLSATLNIPNNAVGSPQTVPLSATVIPRRS